MQPFFSTHNTTHTMTQTPRHKHTHLAGEHPKQQYDAVPAPAVPGVVPAAQVAKGGASRRCCVAQQRQAAPVCACAAECELSAPVVLHLAEDLAWQHGGLLLNPPVNRSSKQA